MPTLKLGKKPAVYDSRTLFFRDYLQGQLDPPPNKIDYGSKVDRWPMYLNDQYGDCTCAAAGHMIQAWTANASNEVSVSDQAVLTFYEHFVGSPPPPDAGCNMLQVLKYWRSTGLEDHKVLAFSALELGNATEARDAVYLFGSAYLGLALPNFAVDTQDMLGIPWVVPPPGPVGDAAPNPQNGHCVPAVAYDARNLYVVTWGVLKSMSWQFYNAYVEEAYAVLSTDFIGEDQKAPPGFDLSTLQKDLKQVSSTPASRAHYRRSSR